GRVDDGFGADDAGDHAAAVDVADEDDGYVGRPRKPHVGDVACTQVYLGGAARAFDQHDVRLVTKAGIAVQHERHQVRLHPLIGGSLGGSVDQALHDDLRSDLALRL